MENFIVEVPEVFGEGGRIDTRNNFHSCRREDEK